MFGYENETSFRIYTSKQIFEKHVDLLPMFNTKNLHHILIKDFNKFVSKKAKHHGKENIFILLTMSHRKLSWIYSYKISFTN